MKTKFLALCILATLTLTACTGKEPPIIDTESSSNVAKSSSQEENNSSENIPSENIPNREVESSDNNQPSTENNEQTSVVSNGDYTEFPQEVLDFSENNGMEIKVESSEEYNIYISETDNYIMIGAILDLTNEEDPKILYHHHENAKEVGGMDNEDASMYTTTGQVFAVKTNSEKEITEFLFPPTEPGKPYLKAYGKLRIDMGK